MRRVIYEDAYVAVPVTEALMTKKEDGSFGLDTSAFEAEAIRISHDPRVEWQVESSHLELHPTQQPMPDDRRCLDTFYG
jgi:hypothetical protein